MDWRVRHGSATVSAAPALRCVLSLTVALLLSANGLVGHADADQLDPMFGSEGLVRTFFRSSDRALDVAVQQDGKIVAAGVTFDFQGAGNFAVARYLFDGRPDPGFGGDGRVTTAVGDSSAVREILIAPGGKILALGHASMNGQSNMALARYNADGTLDSAFGSGGIVTSDVLPAIAAAAWQDDGKIVLTSGGRGESLLRLRPDGSADVTFGGGSPVAVDFAHQVTDVAIQSDGKIVVSGQDVVIVGHDSEGPIARPVFAVARLNRDGTVDRTFGDGGKVVTEMHQCCSDAFEVLVQSDGKIVAVGRANADFAVARYNADGSLDASFGTGGKVTTSLAGFDRAVDAALQTDGKLVAVGRATGAETRSDFGVVRYNVDGSLDSTFGTNGLFTTDFRMHVDDEPEAVVITPDGKAVAAGHMNRSPGSDNFALARYRGRPLTREDGLQDMIRYVDALVEGRALNPGEGASLTQKLNVALRHLEDGAVGAARNEINAVIRQVDALVVGDQLGPTSGRTLKHVANEVLALIS
jgi:uncharacterized delta-60 repeat protein